jgi:L-fuculose-phosphate aldolase
MSIAKEDKLRKLVVQGAKAIYAKGLVEAGEGNVSIRNGKKKELFITPSFNQYTSLTENDVVLMNFDGEALSIGKLPSTEVKMHTAIYESRPKVAAVIHTHSSYATIISTVQKSIPIIMEEMYIFLGGSIDISDPGEAHTEEMGKVALNALGRKNAALLANHGVIVCGKSIDHAVKFSELVEKLAKIYWGSLQIGEPKTFSIDQLEGFRKLHESLFANFPKKERRR